jgi:prepilin-type N-terminal cleavage/methylation domain-containing protein/prepilin-type processing-associated H-X9-DG protein
MNKRTRGFTLVELMVVIAIIALLMSIAAPALNRVLKQGRAMKSSDNVRSWGQGALLYATESNDLLPWEGYKTANRMGDNMADPNWWANAIPERLGQPTYKELYDEGIEMDKPNVVPMPEDGTIFCDPAANAPTNAPYTGGGKHFFFCYVPNSQLNNTFVNDDMHLGVPIGIMRKPSQTAMMIEMRTDRDELAPDDPFYFKSLNRHRADWKRFAARHLGGGHIAFGDGHVERKSNYKVTTNLQGSRDPDHPGGDWNANGVIWDPQGPAID